MRIKEAGKEFIVDEGVFYNPFMRVSREISYLVLGELGRLRVLDAFSASGVRGILYKLKNENVEEIDFLDYSQKAVENIRKNLELHGVKGGVYKEEFNRFIVNTEKRYNFIELDPFGSPVPYLYNALSHLSKNKVSFISCTATDLQTLCGVNKKACLKFYQSNQKNTYFCHETGLRIVIKKIAELASEFNLVVKPIVSFYYRHQFKTIIKLVKDGERADKNHEMLRFLKFRDGLFSLTYDSREIGKIWVGELGDEDIMKKVLKKEMSKESRNIIECLLSENRFPPYFYSSHEIARMFKSNPLSLEFIEKVFRKKGFDFSKTHFSPEGFKTTAKSEEVLNIFKSLYENNV